MNDLIEKMDVISEGDKALRKFLIFKYAKNLSEATLKTYKFHIETFLRNTDPNNENSIDCLCTEDNFIRFEIWLKEYSSLSDISINSYCRSVKVFLNWCVKTYHLPSFSDSLQLPKYNGVIPPTYDDSELRKLLEKPNGKVPATEYMTWVMINVFISTGMRLNSLRNLSVRDISFDEKAIKINTTKNNDPLYLRVGVSLFPILMEYVFRFRLTNDDYLFCTGDHGIYSARTIEDYIVKYERNRGIFKRRAVHAFRHTFAKKYYLKTRDVLSLKNILGHKSLDITNKYLRELGFAVPDRVEFDPRVELDLLETDNINRKQIIEIDKSPSDRKLIIELGKIYEKQ